MDEVRIRAIVQEILSQGQYSVPKVPYHIHNNIDAPLVYLPFQIVVGSGAPTNFANEGTLYINTTATSGTTRFYINVSGGTSWAYFTASA